MNNEHIEVTIKSSKQIDEYLKLPVRNKKKLLRLSFEEIIGCFLGEFVVDTPDRAKIFVNDRVARSVYVLLKRAAVLLENYLPKIEFDRYLHLCIANDCQPKKVCEFSSWYNKPLIWCKGKPGKNQDKKNIYYVNSGKEAVQFYLWLPHDEVWIKKSISLKKFTKAAQKKFHGVQPIESRKILDQVVVTCGVFLFYLNSSDRKSIFEFITHVICCALKVYDLDITAEMRLDYLLVAHDYISELILNNIAQSNFAKKNRPDALSQLMAEELSNAPSLTINEMKYKITELESHGVIDEVTDDEINFIHKGNSKSSPVSGLGSRYFRIKTKLK